jgi:hypothetical protein
MEKVTTPERKLSPCERRVVEFCEKHAVAQHMFDKVAKSISTKVRYATGIEFFCEHLGKNPTEIVEEYVADVKANAYDAFDKWERIFDDFAIFLEKKKNFASASVALYHAGAKALINTNVPRSLRLQAETPESYSRTIPGNTVDELKKIYGLCNVPERAYISFFKDSGMSKADAIIVNVGDLEDFEKGEQWIHLNVYRGKEKVEYETFLGPNAVRDLRAFFTLRESRGEKITKDSPIFIIDERPYTRMTIHALSTHLYRIHKRSGINFSSHRLRKFFETYMALTVRHPIVLKYWMGHAVRGKKSRDIESRYILPPTPEQLKLYKEAYKNIDLSGGTVEERVKAIEGIMGTMSDDQKDLMRKFGVTMMRKKEKVDESEEKTERDAEEPNVQKIVSESELAENLASGWRVVTALPSGKIIIEIAAEPPS